MSSLTTSFSHHTDATFPMSAGATYDLPVKEESEHDMSLLYMQAIWTLSDMLQAGPGAQQEEAEGTPGGTDELKGGLMNFESHNTKHLILALRLSRMRGSLDSLE